MKTLGAYLEKFKKLAPPDDMIRSEVVRVAQEIAGVELEKKDVTVRNFVVYVKSDPGVRSELFMHKRQILKRLEEVFEKKAPKDIR